MTKKPDPERERRDIERQAAQEARDRGVSLARSLDYGKMVADIKLKVPVWPR